MKKLMFLTSLLCLLFLNSCLSDDDCGECFTPPNFFYFQFVDKDSGDDLVATGVYDKEDIMVVDAQNEEVEFDYYLEEGKMYVLDIVDIGWETEIVTYHIKLGDEEVVTLHVDAVREMGDCCSYTRYNDVTVDGAEYSTEKSLYEVSL